MKMKVFCVAKTTIDFSVFKKLINEVSSIDLSGQNDSLTIFEKPNNIRASRSNTNGQHYFLTMAILCNWTELQRIVEWPNINKTVHECKNNVDFYIVICSASYDTWANIENSEIKEYLDAIK